MQHASQYACNGSATTGYNNSNVCNNSSKQESSGFLNLDTAHENHSDERDDSRPRHAARDPDRHLDVRRRRPARPNTHGAERDELRAARRRPLLTRSRRGRPGAAPRSPGEPGTSLLAGRPRRHGARGARRRSSAGPPARGPSRRPRRPAADRARRCDARPDPAPAGAAAPLDSRAIAAAPARLAPAAASPPGGLARATAEDYRRRAPLSALVASPLADDDDPIVRERTRVTDLVAGTPRRGADAHGDSRHGGVRGAGAGRPLRATLSVGDADARRRARCARASPPRTSTPVGEVEYHDDGADGDAVADDRRVHRALRAAGRPIGEAPLSASYLVQVEACTAGDEERLAATSFLYSAPRRASSRARSATPLVGGNLVVEAEVDVARSRALPSRGDALRRATRRERSRGPRRPPSSSPGCTGSRSPTTA